MSRSGAWFLVLLALMGVLTEAARTPPGIAKNPSNARCLDDKFKECYNLVHVCPKFCPDSCTVHCQSCKPICSGGSVPSSPPVPPVSSTPPPALPTPSPVPAIPKPPVSSTPPTSSPPVTVPTPKTPPTLTPPPSTPTSPPSVPALSPPTTVPTPQTPPSSSTPPPSVPRPSPPQVVPTPQTPPTVHTPQTPPFVPTPSTPPSKAPPTSTTTPTVSSPKTAKCTDPRYSGSTCYNFIQKCPVSCPGGCEVDCYTCKPFCRCDKPGLICEDPRFTGADGITFYFHGKKDQDFCLLTDSNLHINGHFIGRRNSNMKRDFTWVQSVGLLFDNHQIFVGAQKTSTWDDSVDRLALSFDGEPILLSESEGAKWQSVRAPGLTFTRSHETNSIVVEVEGKFKVSATVVPITEEDSRVHSYGVTKEDCFAHLDLGFKFYELSEEVDGVLGKTYSRDYVSKVKMGVSMPVVGGDKDFSTSGIFATDCKVSRFVASALGVGSETGEYASLSCDSGMGGRGVVCKR